MKNSIIDKIIFFLLVIQFSIINAQIKLDTDYGNNKAIGKYVEINGAKIYYEEYGKGEPLLIIHGCGADIKSMEYQIDYFKDKYRVIAADSRGQGKSELKTDSLTYTQMARRHHIDMIQWFALGQNCFAGVEIASSNLTLIDKSAKRRAFLLK